MPEVKAGHHVEPDVLLPAGGALQTAVDRLPPLVSHAAERAGTFRDVMVEEVDTGVRALPQVGGREVCHAGCFLIVVSHHVIHVGV